ncbi:USP6 N-terminal-like protein [Vulpes lagopus]
MVLSHRVFKGGDVPPQLQGQMWLHLLDIEQIKARNPGKYQGALRGASALEQVSWSSLLGDKEMKEEAQVSSQDIKQIDLDINRTFHNHIMFWDRYGVR